MVNIWILQMSTGRSSIKKNFLIQSQTQKRFNGLIKKMMMSCCCGLERRLKMMKEAHQIDSLLGKKGLPHDWKRECWVDFESFIGSSIVFCWFHLLCIGLNFYLGVEFPMIFTGLTSFWDQCDHFMLWPKNQQIQCFLHYNLLLGVHNIHLPKWTLLR